MTLRMTTVTALTALALGTCSELRSVRAGKVKRVRENPPVALRLGSGPESLNCSPGVQTGAIGTANVKTVYLCGSSESPVILVQGNMGWTAIARNPQGEPSLLRIDRVSAGSKVVFEDHWRDRGALVAGSPRPATSTLGQESRDARAIQEALSIWNAQANQQTVLTDLGEPAQSWVNEFHGKANERLSRVNALMSGTDTLATTTPDGTPITCHRYPRKIGFPATPGCEYYSCPDIEFEGLKYNALLYQPGNLADSWPGTSRLTLSRPNSLGPILFGVETRIPGNPVPVDSSILAATGTPLPMEMVSERTWQDRPIPNLGISMNQVQMWSALQDFMGGAILPPACDGLELPALLNQQASAHKSTEQAIRSLEVIQVLEEVQDGFQSSLVPAVLVDNSVCSDRKGRLWEAGTYSRSSERRYQRRFAPEEGRAVTMARAQRLFDELKSRKDVPWGFAFDGCYARAEIAERFLERRGIQVSKTWITGELTPKSHPNIRWSYHVAASIPVVQEDGRVLQMVFDPALATGPITEEEWAHLMEMKDPLMRGEFPPPTNSSFYGRTVLSRSSDYPYVPSGNSTYTERETAEAARLTNRMFRDALEFMPKVSVEASPVPSTGDNSD